MWVGSWKNRTDSPLGITWTNESVKTLGVYFGNDNTSEKTFLDIILKIKRSMNYWKQFKLCKFAKARVTEIFHASRLWYASTFYPIPNKMKTDLQASFKEYINFPRRPTVSETEMKKLRTDGGIKLIDIQTRIDTSRCMWLLNLVHNPELKASLAVMSRLVGMQKGGLIGPDLIFTDIRYSRLLRIPNSMFYLQGLKAAAKLTLNKRIDDLNEEKIFYNPFFRDENLHTIPITKRCERHKVYTYGEVAQEYVRQSQGLPHVSYIANIYPRITHFDIHGKSQNTIFLSDIQATVSFGVVTHKNVYEELLRKNYVDHHSEEKWEHKFQSQLNWSKIWESLNNPVTTEKVKTTIWEQIHLNDYCTYSYNKWHKTNDPCPLCALVPLTKFHLTLDCPVTVSLWQQLEPYLLNLSPCRVTDYEKVFGIVGNSPEIILRNWLTFHLRQCIVEQESIAFHNKRGVMNEEDIKEAYNIRIKEEVLEKSIIYPHLGRQAYFEKIFAVRDFLITWNYDNWQILSFF